jgi:hypothetical protein
METPSRNIDWSAPLLIALALGIAGCFFIAFGLHSYHPSDHGWLLGYAWRLAGGQTPYVDFVYRRPPGSIYLHSLWLLLPDGWAFLTARFAFYLELALSGGLVAWAARSIGLAPAAWKLGLLGVSFTALTIHNFPAMAWNTVDGVFFCSAGLAALLVSLGRLDAPELDRRELRRALVWRGAASGLLAIGVLCKQPFAAVALVFALGVFGEFLLDRTRPGRARWLILLASALPALGVLGAIGALLTRQGAFAPMLEQIFVAGGGRGLRVAGVMRYLESGSLWLVLPGIAWPWLVAQSKGRVRWIGAGCALLAGLGLAAAVQRQQIDGDAIFFVLLGITLGRGVRIGIEHAAGRPIREAGLRLVLALGVVTTAWCASLSWGMRSPLLGLAAMAVVVDDLIPASIRPNRGWLITPLLLCLLGGVVVVNVTTRNLERPYADRPIRRQTAQLETIFPRFGRVSTNPGLFKEMSELRELVTRHALVEGRSFTVLDDFPLIHYLVDAQNPALMDWYWPSERQGLNAMLLAQLRELDAVFLLYRGKAPSPYHIRRREGGPCMASEFEGMPLKAAVFANSRLVESARFFCVLERNQPPSTSLGTSAGTSPGFRVGEPSPGSSGR